MSGYSRHCRQPGFGARNECRTVCLLREEKLQVSWTLFQERRLPPLNIKGMVRGESVYAVCGTYTSICSWGDKVKAVTGLWAFLLQQSAGLVQAQKSDLG